MKTWPIEIDIDVYSEPKTAIPSLASGKTEGDEQKIKVKLASPHGVHSCACKLERKPNANVCIYEKGVGCKETKKIAGTEDARKTDLKLGSWRPEAR